MRTYLTVAVLFVLMGCGEQPTCPLGEELRFSHFIVSGKVMVPFYRCVLVEQK